ncbi:protein of unknown function (plasmid) [Cupriavidus taiwanensis]|nr:protein of unknown function [Cupriavidus taiwanensis]SPA11325.1 protein of unknown function [Cupriavidus taiwanensis]
MKSHRWQFGPTKIWWEPKTTRGVPRNSPRITRRNSAQRSWRKRWTRHTHCQKFRERIGLGANLASTWLQDHEHAAASEPDELFLPIEKASPRKPEPIESARLVIECRRVRVRFEGKPEPDVLQLVLPTLLGGAR